MSASSLSSTCNGFKATNTQVLYLDLKHHRLKHKLALTDNETLVLLMLLYVPKSALHVQNCCLLVNL